MRNGKAFMIILFIGSVLGLVSCAEPVASALEESASRQDSAEEETFHNVSDAGLKNADMENGIQDSGVIRDTRIQSLPPEYFPIEEAGVYDTSIITPELLGQYQMHEMTAADMGYLTGYILEDKILRTFRPGLDYKENDNHFMEDEIRYLSENGFNCARVLYSFSFISNPDDVTEINESELKQLDELVSWGLKYNVHIMVSNTGIAGKGNYSTDEWDDSLRDEMTDIIYLDRQQAEIYREYWEVLAKRYADLPANVISFELAVESLVPEDDMELYEETLEPVAKAIWDYNPERIVIVNDLGHCPPEKLAQIGCCISLHNHIYSLYDDYGEGGGFQNKPDWPRDHIPHTVFEGDEVEWSSETGFQDTKLTIYYEYYNCRMRVRADSAVLYEPDMGNPPVYEPFIQTIDIPDGTGIIALESLDEAGIWAYELRQGENRTAFTTSWNVGHDMDICPGFTVMADGSYTLDKGLNIDEEFLYRAFLQDFIDCAKKNNVSFLMTEIGTDVISLTPQEYIAYHSLWLKLCKENEIGWMYNCVHNFLAPEDMMWLNRQNSKFTEFSETDIPNYVVNDAIRDMLVQYQ